MAGNHADTGRSSLRMPLRFAWQRFRKARLRLSRASAFCRQLHTFLDALSHPLVARLGYPLLAERTSRHCHRDAPRYFARHFWVAATARELAQAIVALLLAPGTNWRETLSPSRESWARDPRWAPTAATARFDNQQCKHWMSRETLLSRHFDE